MSQFHLQIVNGLVVYLDEKGFTIRLGVERCSLTAQVSRSKAKCRPHFQE